MPAHPAERLSVVALDHLVAHVGDVLAGVETEAVADRGHHADEALLEVEVLGLAADGGLRHLARRVIHDDLGELVALHRIHR